MIITTNDNPTSNEVIEALYPKTESRGFLIAEFDSGKKLLKTKIPFDKVSWFLSQLPASRRLAVSASAFHGKRILPNFRASALVSIALDKARTGASTSEQLRSKIYSAAAEASCPLPTAVVVSPSDAFAVWRVDRPYEILELGELHIVEYGLASLLSAIGASTNTIHSASRSLPLPNRVAQDGALVGWMTNGSLKAVDRNRLLRCIQPLITREAAECLSMNCEVVEELGTLLFSRTLLLDQQPEHYATWMSGYAGSTCKFTAPGETKRIARSVTESLLMDWARHKNNIVPGLDHKYVDYLDILARNAQVAHVKLGTGYFAVSDERWPNVLADLLEVTQEEIYELGLRRLIPFASEKPNRPNLRIRGEFSVGVEDYVPLQEFLLAA